MKNKKIIKSYGLACVVITLRGKDEKKIATIILFAA